MAPVRLDLTMRLARELGVLDQARASWRRLRRPSLLLSVHSADFVAAVGRARAGPRAISRTGSGTPDVPVFADMHEVSSLVAATTSRPPAAVLAR